MYFCKVQKDRYTNSNAISQFNRMFDTKFEYCLTSSAASGFFKERLDKFEEIKKKQLQKTYTSRAITKIQKSLNNGW